ncbi:MAG: transposase [Armatimonadota bacterium]
MPRFARVIAPGCPHHITHRGNRNDDVFFSRQDREDYCRILAEYAEEYGLEIWAHCLMTTHIHVVAVPAREDSLALAIGRAHMKYARWVNRRQGWQGHLWANRFYSTVLDEAHCWAAMKYIERNPIRAGLATRAEDYPWSSARAHILGQPDPLLTPSPLEGTWTPADWSAWVNGSEDDEIVKLLRANTNTGWPTGAVGFVEELEQRLDRRLSRLSPGRKPKA